MVLPCEQLHPPEFVEAIPCLPFNLEGLQRLFDCPHPPRTLSVPKALYRFFTGLGMPLGRVLGMHSCHPVASNTQYRFGVWENSLAGKSTNFWELFNLTSSMEEHVASMCFPHLTQLVNALESLANLGMLTKAEVFLFTDNAVAEGAFYKGTSTNRSLFELMLRLKQLEFNAQLCLHVIHISGVWMQAQETDAHSQGSPFKLDPIQQVPLHLSAVTRSMAVTQRCQSFLPPTLELLTLSIDDWSYAGHRLTTTTSSPHARIFWRASVLSAETTAFLWMPPPAAGRVAIEQLTLSRLKRPSSTHIFASP